MKRLDKYDQFTYMNVLFLDNKYAKTIHVLLLFLLD